MRKILFALLCVAVSTPASAATTFQQLRALGYAQMTSLSAATALPSVPSGTQEAFIVCTGQTVYWRDDGTSPTASVGVPLLVNTGFPYTGSLSKIKIIETTPSATCNVSYYGS